MNFDERIINCDFTVEINGISYSSCIEPMVGDEESDLPYTAALALAESLDKGTLKHPIREEIEKMHIGEGYDYFRLVPFITIGTIEYDPQGPCEDPWREVGVSIHDFI